MNDISMMGNPKISTNRFRAVGLLVVAGVLTTAAQSRAWYTETLCPHSEAGGPNPVVGVLDQGGADCWTGSSWETGTSWAMGSISTTSGSGRSVGAYAFWGLEHSPPPWMGGYSPFAVSFAYDSNNNYKCMATDYAGDGSWVFET